MKNQELHNLKIGELERFVQHVIPFFKEHRTKFYVAAGVLFLLVIGYAYFSTREPANSKEWRSMYSAVLSGGAPEAKQKYKSIANDSPETTPGMWALLKLADDTLNTGLRNRYTDGAGAKKDIKSAGEMYHKLINASSISDDIRERTLYGLARVADASSNGKTEIAIKEYKKLMEQFPKSAFISLVESRIKSLEKDKAKQFYAWFSQETPTIKDTQTIIDAIGSPATPAGNSSPKFDLGSTFPDTPEKEQEDKKKEADLNPFEKETPVKETTKTSEEKKENNPFEKEENEKKEAQTKEKIEPNQETKKESPFKVPSTKEEKKE
ncbi:hypothetical protein MNBD_PLANCTO02-785 [hydrothermal vent metagenome]|uniref:Tetratricopeptide repeat-like domain-containing protein n=1 Tax=hydrothermal vent metagenome TaxID=652676 RepID=A0A3B1DZQ8_9ZZZZ